MALITTSALSDAPSMYVLYNLRIYNNNCYTTIDFCFIITMNTATTVVALSAVTQRTILRQFTKNYNLFEDTTPNASIMPA